MRDKMKLHDAIIFATEAHAGQKRKGTDIDYICHPLEVTQILTEMDPENTDLIIAGVLHDAVEDTDCSIEDVRCKFGDTAARLVEAHTHPKEGEWIERKKAAVESVKNAPPDVKRLVLADKLSNLRSIYADFRVWGPNIWERFNAPEFLQRKYRITFGKDRTREEMIEAERKVKRKLGRELFEQEKQIPGSMQLSAGSCDICINCTRNQGAPCAHPDLMHYSIESIGGNVAKTIEDICGIEIEWIEGDRLPEHFVLVGALLMAGE